MTEAVDSRFISFKPAPQVRLRLFCFPYAGGGASMFYAWSSGLPPEVQVCPVHLPGRENRLTEPPFTRLSPLVQKLARVLLPFTDMPFAIFGHSLGAVIGFELGRELRRQHRLRPIHLFVSARRAPQLPNHASPLHQLRDAEFLQELLSRYNGIPKVILQDRELMKLFLPVIKADMAILETYAYASEEPLECPISAFGGLLDREISHADLEAWSRQTRSTFAVQMFPGDHFFIQSARAYLLRALSQDLSLYLSRMTGEQRS